MVVRVRDDDDDEGRNPLARLATDEPAEALLAGEGTRSSLRRGVTLMRRLRAYDFVFLRVSTRARSRTRGPHSRTRTRARTLARTNTHMHKHRHTRNVRRTTHMLRVRARARLSFSLRRPNPLCFSVFLSLSRSFCFRPGLRVRAHARRACPFPSTAPTPPPRTT